VSSFPFATLEAFTRSEVDAAARLRRIAARYVRLADVAAALSEIVSSRVEILVRRVSASTERSAASAMVGVVLAAPDEAAFASRHVLVEVDAALAATLVARTIRQPSPRIVDASRASSPLLAGAIGGVLLTALRRAHAGLALTIVGAGPSGTWSRDGTPWRTLTAWLTVIVGDDAYDARATVCSEAAISPLSALSAESLARLGDVVLGIPLVVGTVLAARSELRGLERGDALVFRSSTLANAPGGALLGRVALVAPTSESALPCDLADGGGLVIRGPVERHAWDSPEVASMSSEPTTIEVLEDVPVVVRVELGVVEMKAREWAALAPGDVVALGRKVGEPAVLRAGGVEIARGELVVVDGEYGVKILAVGGAA
jgi:type III secretion protein Q